jgi:hypothetical protein
MNKKVIAVALPVLLSVGVAVVGVDSAFANSSSNQDNQTAIDKFKTEANKVQDIAQNIIPTAIASVVFASGALLFKRFIYS